MEVSLFPEHFLLVPPSCLGDSEEGDVIAGRLEAGEEAGLVPGEAVGVVHRQAPLRPLPLTAQLHLPSHQTRHRVQDIVKIRKFS